MDILWDFVNGILWICLHVWSYDIELDFVINCGQLIAQFNVNVIIKCNQVESWDTGLLYFLFDIWHLCIFFCTLIYVVWYLCYYLAANRLTLCLNKALECR